MPARYLFPLASPVSHRQYLQIFFFTHPNTHLHADLSPSSTHIYITYTHHITHTHITSHTNTYTPTRLPVTIANIHLHHLHTYITHTYVHTSHHTYIHHITYTYLHTYITHLHVYLSPSPSPDSSHKFEKNQTSHTAGLKNKRPSCSADMFNSWHDHAF